MHHTGNHSQQVLQIEPGSKQNRDPGSLPVSDPLLLKYFLQPLVVLFEWLPLERYAAKLRDEKNGYRLHDRVR